MTKIGVTIMLMALSLSVFAARNIWDMKELSKTPKVFDYDGKTYGSESWGYGNYLNDPALAETDKQNDYVKNIMYKGVDYEGKETRVQAYIGIPNVPKGKKVPGIVLIHGGGGSAFEAWVRQWNAMGYAAIAMDTVGNISNNTMTGIHSEFGGPACDCQDYEKPLKDQWTYQAVADCILAHSLLRSFPQVDKNNIGVMGVSWGGYLTCIVSSVDTRFKFAMPVYGTGYLWEYSPTVGRVTGFTTDIRDKWLVNWDPSIYLKDSKVPTTWFVSNVDWCYWLLGVKESYDCMKVKDKNIVIFDGWTHGHVDIAYKKEAQAVADFYTKKKDTMPKILTEKFENGTFSFTAKNTDHAYLFWTESDNPQGTPDGQNSTKWEKIPADFENGKGSVKVPDQAKVFYANVFTEDETLQKSSQIYKK